ncbi:MAG: hypothetical protein IPP84_15515, partial [Propionivibrio sp.]
GDYGELTGNGRLLGNDFANALRDGAGDDELYGFGGKDTLIATGGNDRLYGGDGDDALQGGADNDLLDGGLGNDVLAGGTGNDILLGGDGDDILFGSGSYEASRANWSAVADPTSVLLNLDGFLGDPFVGNGGADLLRGGAGNDWLFGGEAADQLYGDEDNDRLYGQAGDDAPIRSGINTAKDRVKWRSRAQRTGKPMLTRPFEEMPPRTFVHKLSRGALWNLAAYGNHEAQNNSRWELAA